MNAAGNDAGPNFWDLSAMYAEEDELKECKEAGPSITPMQ
jgi:hypothetical protein